MNRMGFTFQPIVLDTPFDSHGVLVFRDGRLVAIASCLDAGHEDLEGRWAIEKLFPEWAGAFGTFETLEALEARLEAAAQSGKD